MNKIELFDLAINLKVEVLKPFLDDFPLSKVEEGMAEALRSCDLALADVVRRSPKKISAEIATNFIAEYYEPIDPRTNEELQAHYQRLIRCLRGNKSIDKVHEITS